MAAPNAHSWKLQEFIAHQACVNCLCLGRKSGRVLVTGGDDRKVNLWAVGKPTCIMSLSGHTTSIECVQFGHNEELVCAGSSSGAIKVWDLEAAKIIRTLTGHKSNLKCVDFHPYADFLASGSSDTNIKLWDVRRKGCIFTYKGHTNTVNGVKFSPDGKWIASAGDDGRVKLWDLMAGKMLAEFGHHTAPVSDIEFHPNDFLLASGAADRTVKFWDLENFQLVSSTDGDCGAIRCLQFNVDGSCVYGGALDTLQVYGWEPARTFDTVLTGWGKVSDIAMAQHQLIGASFQMSTVSIYVVDLKKVQPYGISISSLQHGTPVRKSFNRFKPLSLSTKHLAIKSSSEDEASTPDLESGESHPPVSNYHEIFHPRNRKLTRTPPPSDSYYSSLEDCSVKTEPVWMDVPQKEAPQPPSSLPVTHFPPPPPPPLQHKENTLRRISEPVTIAAASNPELRYRQMEASLHQPPPVPYVLPSQHVYRKETSTAISSTVYDRFTSQNVTKSGLPKGVSLGSGLNLAGIGLRPEDMIPTKSVSSDKLNSGPGPGPVLDQTPERLMADSGGGDYIAATRENSTTLNMDEFLPNNQRLSGLSRDPSSYRPVSDSEAIQLMSRGHGSMLSVMKTRARNLLIVHTVWHSKDIKAALESATNMNELSIIVDIVNIIYLRPPLWTLDVCVVLLPSVYELLQSKYESYVLCGCNATRLILRNFGSLIRSNVSAAPGIGIDLSREERYNKCLSCYNLLVSIRAFVMKRQTLQGKLGHTFRELGVLLQAFD